MAQSCADVLTMIMDTAKAISSFAISRKRCSRKRGIASYRSIRENKILGARTNRHSGAPKVTANDGGKEPMPRELGTKEELLNVFLRKKRL